VSLLKLTSVCLCQFLLLNTCAFLCRVLGTRTAPRGESPYMRMRRGGRPTVSTTNDCGNGGKDVWRAMRSPRVRRSPVWRGCCMILWLRPAGMSSRDSLKERKKKFPCAPLAPFKFSQFFLSLILQHLSQGSADTLKLQAELTRA
jgi:hypothetical protein